MEAEMDEDLQAGRRADVFQVRPGDEVLQSTERPQPEAACGSHDALPRAVGRGEHQQAVHSQDARELFDRAHRGVGVLEHLAGDDDVEAFVAEGEAADVGHDAVAARAGDRPRDQSLPDIDADHGRPQPCGGCRERAVAAPGIQRPLADEPRLPQALVEHDAQAPVQVVGMVEVLEAVSDGLIEVLGRLARHDWLSSRGRGGPAPRLPRDGGEAETGAPAPSRPIRLSEYFASPPSRSRSAYGSTTVLYPAQATMPRRKR